MFKFAYLALIGCSTVSAANGPGLGASVTQNGISTAKNILTPYVFKFIKDINIPEIDFDGGKLQNIEIQVPEPDTKNIDINLDSKENGLELMANSVQAKLNTDFTFKYFVTVSGKAAVNIKKLNLDAEFDASTQPGTPATDLAPMVTVSKINVDINPDDIDITLSGGLVAKIASVFIPLFKSTLIPLIVSNLEDTVKSTISTTIDQDLKLYGSQQVIPYLAGVTFDYAQMGKGIEVTSDGVATMGLNGTFFDAEDLEPSTFKPATFALRDPKGKDFQGYLTDYVLNTAFKSGYLTGNTLDITYLLQNYLNLTVTTDNLGLVVPEILTKYGSGKAVGLSGKFVQKAAESHFTSSGQSIDGGLAVTVTIDNESAIYAEFDSISGLAALNSKSGAIFGSISKSSLGTILASSFTSTLGLTADGLLKDLQSQVDGYVATANELLKAGIVIPKIFGIDVSDVEIDFFQGYLELGMTVKEDFWLGVREAARFWAEEIEFINSTYNMEPLTLELNDEKFLQ